MLEKLHGGSQTERMAPARHASGSTLLASSPSFQYQPKGCLCVG
jgi:hypothetical protein